MRWELTIYRSHPKWVLAKGVGDISIADAVSHWRLQTDKRAPATAILVVDKSELHCAPEVHTDRGLIEIHFIGALFAERWAEDQVTKGHVSTIHRLAMVGAEMNEKRVEVIRGVISGPTPRDPKGVQAVPSPQEELCGPCWLFHTQSMGRPCGECKP